MKTRGKLPRGAISLPLLPFRVATQRWALDGGRGRREVAFISKLSFKISTVPRRPGGGGGGGRGRRERGERGEEATPNKNKRAFPPLHPKLDFNFRDIINFSRPLSSQPRSRPRVSSPPEKKRKRKGRTRYYLEIRGSVTPVVGG